MLKPIKPVQHVIVDKLNGTIYAFITGDAGLIKVNDNHKIYLVSPHMSIILKIGDTFPIEKNNALLKMGKADSVTETRDLVVGTDGVAVEKRIIEIPSEMLHDLPKGYAWHNVERNAGNIVQKYLGGERLFIRGQLDFDINQKTGHGKATTLGKVLRQIKEGFTEDEWLKAKGEHLPNHDDHSKTLIVNGKVTVQYYDSRPDLQIGSVSIDLDIAVRVKYSPTNTIDLTKKNTIVNDDTDDDEPKKKKGMRI